MHRRECIRGTPRRQRRHPLERHHHGGHDRGQPRRSGLANLRNDPGGRARRDQRNPTAFESYTPGLPSSPGASVAAAVASAAANVLLALVPSQVQVINQRLSDALAAIPDGPPRNAGIALGTEAAQAILARRQDDGADTPGPPLPSNPMNPNDPYVSTNLPGENDEGAST